MRALTGRPSMGRFPSGYFRRLRAMGGGLVLLLASAPVARAQANPACPIVLTSDRVGVGGTTPARAADRSIETSFRTDYNGWQYLQVDLGCVGDFSGVRRYMSKGGSIAGKRALQGEALAYSVNGASWVTVARANTTGWEGYVAASSTSWHSVPYGWSAWLRLRAPVKARFIRFRWDGDTDLLHEVEAFFHEPTPDPLSDGLRDLAEESSEAPRVRFDRGIPRFVKTRIPVTPGLPDDPVVQALDFLKRHQAFYRLADPLAQLYLKRVVRKDGTHVFFGQHRDGVAVHGAGLAVHFAGDEVIGTSGVYLPSLPELPTALLSGQDATARATERLQKKGLGKIKVVGAPRLVYFNSGLLTGLTELSAGTRQAYRLNLEGRYGTGQPQGWSFLVDAHTGASLRSRPAAAGDAPDKNFDIESALGTTNDKDDWFDENGPLSDYQNGANDPDLEGMNTFGFVHTIYDYFFSRFHRHSYDDDDCQVEVTLDLVFGPNNAPYAAYYSPSSEEIHVAQGQASLNTLAHEFTHGVTDHTADFEYENASGALDEAFANVFAALVEGDFTSFQVTPSRCTVTAGTPGGPPNIFGAPGHMGQTCLWVDPPECDGSDPNWNDCGWVHINDWVVKRAANLIINGGTLNGVTVTGVGATRAESLFYEVLTGWLDGNADFQDMRDATVDRAAARNDFTPTDVCNVINAFGAVGIGIVDLDCDGTPDGNVQDQDGDQLIDAVDNCPLEPNPGQQDLDGDGQGNACDPDDDNDSIGDGLDNCPLAFNPFQENRDGDARGDACDDDDDGDGYADAFDNCPLNRNPDQTNTDGDALGDICDPDDDNDGYADGPDNCDLLANNQANADGDAWGDACDKCPNTSSADQLDIDGDGLGDACDSDLDGDGVSNSSDNCPRQPNPDQTDTDGNGKGVACDLGEQRLLYGSTDAEFLRGLVRFRDRELPVRIPIEPCVEDCPDWFGGGDLLEVKVELPFATRVRVVDDRGDLAARRDASGAAELRFSVASDSRYQPPNEVLGGEAGLFEGRQYFLEILPPLDVVVGKDYEITMRVRPGQRPPER